MCVQGGTKVTAVSLKSACIGLRGVKWKEEITNTDKLASNQVFEPIFKEGGGVKMAGGVGGRWALLLFRRKHIFKCFQL